MAEFPPIVYNLTNNRFEYVDMLTAARELEAVADIVDPRQLDAAKTELGAANNQYLVFDHHAPLRHPVHSGGGLKGKAFDLANKLLKPLRALQMYWWTRQVDYNATVVRALNRFMDPVAEALLKQNHINHHIARLLTNFDAKKIVDLINYLDRKDEGLRLGLRRLEDWYKDLESGIDDLKEEIREAHTEIPSIRKAVKENFHHHRLEDQELHDRIDLLEWNVKYFRQRLDEILLEVGKVKTPAAKRKRIERAREDLKGDDYHVFEGKFRGAEPMIRQRLQPYREFFQDCSSVLDIGCGRGEFLEIMAEANIPSTGLDIKKRMVEVCREKGLKAEQGDLFEYLGGLEAGSLDGIFCSQVVEHLTGDEIIDFLDLAHRVLSNKGRLAIETQNASSVYSLARNFTMDITHETPLHPEALYHILEDRGYAVELRYLHPVEGRYRLKMLEIAETEDDSDERKGLAEQMNKNLKLLDDFLFGFQDFAILAHKPEGWTS